MLRKINKKELLIVAVIITILATLTIPLLFDSDHRAYLVENQQRLLNDAGVIVICKAEQDGDTVNYRLMEVWRNRNNTDFDWAIGDVIPQLREKAYIEYRNAEKKIIFYQPSITGLKFFGSFSVNDNRVYTKLDIGERYIIQRFLDRPVSLSSFKQYVKST